MTDLCHTHADLFELVDINVIGLAGIRQILWRDFDLLHRFEVVGADIERQYLIVHHNCARSIEELLNEVQSEAVNLACVGADDCAICFIIEIDFCV